MIKLEGWGPRGFEWRAQGFKASGDCTSPDGRRRLQGLSRCGAFGPLAFRVGVVRAAGKR